MCLAPSQSSLRKLPYVRVLNSRSIDYLKFWGSVNLVQCTLFHTLIYTFKNILRGFTRLPESLTTQKQVAPFQVIKVPRQSRDFSTHQSTNTMQISAQEMMSCSEETCEYLQRKRADLQARPRRQCSSLSQCSPGSGFH